MQNEDLFSKGEDNEAICRLKRLIYLLVKKLKKFEEQLQEVLGTGKDLKVFLQDVQPWITHKPNFIELEVGILFTFTVVIRLKVLEFPLAFSHQSFKCSS